MTGSVAVDVVISLVFIYLLYSLLATIVQEIISSYFLRLRSKVLEEGIKRMLDDDPNDEHDGLLLSKVFYSSPVIKYLGQSKDRKPAYLAAHNFSKVILDILKGNNPQPGDDFRSKIQDSLTNGIEIAKNRKIVHGETLSFLRSIWAESNGDLDNFKIALEQWFDDAMDRASGWYKRKIQFILFFIGLGIAIIFNVDTIEITRKLSSSPKLTSQVIQQAESFIRSHESLENQLQPENEAIGNINGITKSDSIRKAQSAEEKYNALTAQSDLLLAKADSLLKSDISNLNGLLGTGIQSYVFRGSEWPQIIGFFFLSVLGWLLTALAISLGAPFWFDLLNKLMKIRGSVPQAPGERPTDSSPGKEKRAIVIKS